MGTRPNAATRAGAIGAAMIGSTVLALAAGCGDEPSERQDGSRSTPDAVATSSAEPVADSDPGPLAMVPMTATHLVITDYSSIRDRLGVPDLTSDSLMTDRIEFWAQLPGATVLLSEGVLRPQNSVLDLRYGFTQDDVVREARWAGGGRVDGGFAIDLRGGVDPRQVQRAADDGVEGLESAVVRSDGALVDGVAEPEDAVWAGHPELVAVAETLRSDEALESALLRRDCVPVVDALGVDAQSGDLEAVLADHPIEDLEPVGASAVSVGPAPADESGTELVATVRLAYPVGTAPTAAVADLQARLAMTADWPTADLVGVSDAFDLGAASEPQVVTDTDIDTDGPVVVEVDLPILDVGSAATVLLSDLLPIGVCADLAGTESIAEPTGL